MAIRVLIADDHAVTRHGLAMYLSTQLDIEVIGEAGDGHQVVAMAYALKPDVVLMDVQMPNMSGIEATSVIKSALPDTEVLVITGFLEHKYIVNAIRAGAIGYMLKTAALPDLIRAVRAAAEGKVHLAPEAAARLVNEVRTTDAPGELTDREAGVLRLIAKGYSNKEIATELEIGIKTVKTHVSNVLSKLHVNSRTQAALYAARLGIVQTQEFRAVTDN